MGVIGLIIMIVRAAHLSIYKVAENCAALTKRSLSCTHEWKEKENCVSEGRRTKTHPGSGLRRTQY